MIRIISDVIDCTFGELEYPETIEMEIPEDASTTDMMEIFIHLMHQLGYNQESVYSSIREVADKEVFEDLWY